eukprot:m.15121 g.15121  ORF g.15121 m.15121 type:complete len:842 (-) comp10451_c0_seq1:102-2627(-)
MSTTMLKFLSALVTIVVAVESACPLEYLSGTWIAESEQDKHYTVSSYEKPAEGNFPAMLKLKCVKTIKPGTTKPFARCGWDTANCTLTSETTSNNHQLQQPQMSEGGVVHCKFSNNRTIFEANATASSTCGELLDWTHNLSKYWIKEYHHPSCSSFVFNETCKANPAINYTGCTGGCGTPKNCIDCVLRYSKSSRGQVEAPYICSGGMEEIRQVCNATFGRQPSPVISLHDGDVQGFIDHNSSHFVFRGIPYAHPPLNDLRWRPPQPPTPWTGVLNASSFGATCKQNGPAWASLTLDAIRNSSEDCLYLNVYVPQKYVLARNTSGAKPPTLIYFPAGQYLWGSGNDAENFIAPQTPAGKEMIVVTSNYRLGALGFLALNELRSRDEKNSTGNYGSLDQRQALMWIKNNIGAFGGDPDNVVLWGESAGAAAVTAQLSMPGSWPYFNKAILESGAFNGWSFRTFADINANSMQVVKSLNCSTLIPSDNGTHHIESVNVSCLVNTPVDMIAAYDDDASGLADGVFGMPFGDRIDRSSWAPAIDGVVLSGAPEDLLQSDKVAPVPMLFGTNRDEGSTFTYNQTGVGDSNGGLGPDRTSMYDGFLFDEEQFVARESGHGLTPDEVVKLVESQNFTTGMLVNESEFDVWATNVFGERIGSRLKTIYFPFNATSNHTPPVFNAASMSNWWWAMSRAIGDFALSCPARKAAKLINEFKREHVYVYLFNHTPTMSINQADTYLYGAFHGSEVPFVFYDEFELVRSDELLLSEAMVQYWAGFAWNGDPNTPPPNMVGGLRDLPTFPAYDSQIDSYLILGDGNNITSAYPNITVLTGLKNVECDFWDASFGR